MSSPARVRDPAWDGAVPDGAGPDGPGPDGPGKDGPGKDGSGPDGPGRDVAGPDVAVAPAPGTRADRPRRPSGRRRRRGPGWVPQQHGAWAMLVAPLLVGALVVGPRWEHALLLAVWLVGFCAYNAAGLWLKARRRPRWLPPVRAYGMVTALLAAVLLATAPALLSWGVAYAPLLAMSLRYSARRDERSLANDLLTVTAAGLMTVVAAGVPVAVASAGGPAWVWFPGAADDRAWALATVLVAYFAGTVLYVKTMIRERGNRVMLRSSVLLHAALPVTLLGAAALAPSLGSLLPVPALAVLLAVLAVRAVVVPLRWPAATPKAVGVGEIVATTALVLVLLAA